MIRYEIPSTGKILAITDEVLACFSKHRQIGFMAKEQGGQLFAQIDAGQVTISKATGTRKSDTKGRYHFSPDRKIEQVEINQMFSNGLHYVGDWHTHPEKNPSPSLQDINSMRDCVQKSKNELDSFILVIVGQNSLPSGLWVSLHSPNECERLFVRN